MIEYINNLAGFNLSAILFALVFALIFITIFHFIIWPLISFVLNKILDPIIAFSCSVVNLFKSKQAEEKSDRSGKEVSSIQKFENIISLKFENTSKWFSKNFILKTISLLIIPFILLNYILMCLEYNSIIFPINSNLLNDSLWAVTSAIVVATFFSILLLFSGKKIRETISISSLIFLTIGIVHYFV